ncbi:hypothetical protein FACS1894202_10050 [Clostridia bacterium]|nr:hypothetical protein FACS1894202_10050 [Clostridia bacterium]
MRKFELAVILLTVAMLCVTVGYFLGRVPAAETFEISTRHIPDAPVAEVTVEVTVETTTVITEYVTAEPPVEPFAEPPTGANQSAEPVPSLTPTATPAPTPSGPVNINTAGLTELQRLPGVGPAIAQRILDDRAANGAYRTVDDLMRVKGIGEKTLEKIRPMAVT